MYLYRSSWARTSGSTYERSRPDGRGASVAGVWVAVMRPGYVSRPRRGWHYAGGGGPALAGAWPGGAAGPAEEQGSPCPAMWSFAHWDASYKPHTHNQQMISN